MTQNQAIIQEASKCTNCLEWTHICKAECCRQYVLSVPFINALSLVRGNKIQIRKILCKDRIKYFKLHNATYTHGILEIKLNKFMVKGNNLIIYEDCNGLTLDLKCKYHNKPQQPDVCKSPNILLNKDIPGVVMTENCLYRWK